MTTNKNIVISNSCSYTREEVISGKLKYYFSYKISITNKSDKTIQLTSREWYVTDANGAIKHIQGLGVVGKQPFLKCNTSFNYESWVEIETPVGSMHGSFFFLDNDGNTIESKIKAFTLAKPNLVH